MGGEYHKWEIRNTNKFLVSKHKEMTLFEDVGLVGMWKVK
jgi:hypothetical protein